MIRYQQESPEDDATAAEIEAHVRAHLAAVAASDDDPETNADDVRIFRTRLPDKPGVVLIVGTLEAEPSAEYLLPGYDAFGGVDPGLLKAAGL